MIEEQLSFLKTLVNKSAEFLVNYSFQVFGAIVVLLVGFKVAQWIAKLLDRFCSSKGFDVTLSKFLIGAVRIAIIGFAILVALGKFGITIAPIVAALSALAFGSSFAIQGPLSNYGAGLSLLLTRPFKVGDTIAVSGVYGVVEEVKLACTILNTEDGEKITLPNKDVVGQVLRNSYAFRVVDKELGISYSDDPQKAIALIRSVIDSNAAVAKTPVPVVGIEEFAESSISIGMRYWVPTPRYTQTLYAVNMAIFHALKDAGITLPFPQRDVHIFQK